MSDRLTTLYPHQPTFTEPRPNRNRQGRSKKQLRPVIVHDGRVFVARFEGRPGLFFGPTLQQAQNNLQMAGG